MENEKIPQLLIKIVISIYVLVAEFLQCIFHMLCQLLRSANSEIHFEVGLLPSLELKCDSCEPDVHLEGHGDDEDVPEDDLHGRDPGRAPRPVRELDGDVADLPRGHVERPHAGDPASLGVCLFDIV